MIPIKIDATNLVLILLAGIIALLTSIFPPSFKEPALLSGLGLILFAGLRTMYLSLRRNSTSPQRKKENKPPNKLQQATEQMMLQKAIKLIKSGDKDGGRNLLTDIVASNPESEQAWLWLVSVVPPDKRTFCLEKVISINPNNLEAKQYLEKLKAGEQQSHFQNGSAS
jgi:hypothetical protein